MSIEDILLSYHKTIAKGWTVAVVYLPFLPNTSNEVKAVRINQSYIQFYEHQELETSTSTVFWTYDKEY